MSWKDLIVEPDYVDKAVLPQMENVVARAIVTGGESPFDYLGAGMTSVVLCSSDKKTAFKIARRVDCTNYRVLEAEFEFFMAAQEVPAVAPHVVRTHRFDPETVTIVRACLWGNAGTWGKSKILNDQLALLEREMIPHGWSAPEPKEDSWVFVDEQPILVDGGFAHRVGQVLVDYAEDTLAGRRRCPESLRDIAFSVRMEAGRTIDAHVAAALSDRLKAADSTSNEGRAWP